MNTKNCRDQIYEVYIYWNGLIEQKNRSEFEFGFDTLKASGYLDLSLVNYFAHCFFLRFLDALITVTSNIEVFKYLAPDQINEPNCQTNCLPC